MQNVPIVIDSDHVDFAQIGSYEIGGFAHGAWVVFIYRDGYKRVVAFATSTERNEFFQRFKRDLARFHAYDPERARQRGISHNPNPRR